MSSAASAADRVRASRLPTRLPARRSASSGVTCSHPSACEHLSYGISIAGRSIVQHLRCAQIVVTVVSR